MSETNANTPRDGGPGPAPDETAEAAPQPAENEADATPDETADGQAQPAPEGDADAVPEPTSASPWSAESNGDAEAAPPRDVDSLEGELAETQDKLLRALAEVENVRRRAVRDRSDASRYAIANFAREMLSVADNLRRALDSVSAEARQAHESVNNLMVGVELTESTMLAACERVGIRPIEALDKPFDHNLHEAMFELEDPDRPAGTVVQVLERGFMLYERLLRPAKVGVSKGGPRVSASPAADETDEDDAENRGSAAYEKQVDSQSQGGPSGAKVDENL